MLLQTMDKWTYNFTSIIHGSDFAYQGSLQLEPTRKIVQKIKKPVKRISCGKLWVNSFILSLEHLPHGIITANSTLACMLLSMHPHIVNPVIDINHSTTKLWELLSSRTCIRRWRGGTMGVVDGLRLTRVGKNQSSRLLSLYDQKNNLPRGSQW